MRILEEMGNFDIIMLLKKDITLNPELHFSFFALWNTLINDSIFLFGMISSTLLDISTILGLPVDGDEVSTLFGLIADNQESRFPSP